ncbi:MAG: DNA (cytosine-5-)-methyltransferase [Bacteroidaceae bacterium]|nr:DNA (cytosine-5-)-methyltransferase [Bacteroidaceae bacterium]
MDKPLRVFTAFSGYNSQCLALNLIIEASFTMQKKDGKIYGGCQFDYDLVGWSEIDKYAIQAHNALFPQWSDRNYGDISKIDWSQVPDFDLFTYSSPCQDFSQAGLQAGAAKGSGTRSSLLWECERAIEAKRPKYLIFENVAAVASKKFVWLFNQWQLTLERLGYTNFTQVLNAKTHGYPEPVPQNRERLFMVSILDCEHAFYFPDKQPLTTCIADVLEKNVDEKYYLSEERIRNMRISTLKQELKGNSFAFKPKDDSEVANSITTKACSRKTDNYIKVVGDLQPDNKRPIYPSSKTRRGRIQDGGKVSPTLTTNTEACLRRTEAQNRIRKFTPRECFRLMGVDDVYIDKIQDAGISESRQYMLAGNSIVVNCFAAILKQLLLGNSNRSQQTEIY